MARTIEGSLVSPKGRFALCVARFNAFITEELLTGALDALNRHGVADADVEVVRVPGTFELPQIARRVAHTGRFDALVAPRGYPWKLRQILPRVLLAGRPAGRLTAEGARLLDPSVKLPAGIPLCPPEGDAGTGMVATNAVRPRSGNVSAGTSVFAMIVLEKKLSRVHEEIDIVVTPDGKSVAMAHSNNGSSDYDAWVALFGQAARALGLEARPEELYAKLMPLALKADPDAGGLLSFNYVSGEHVTSTERWSRAPTLRHNPTPNPASTSARIATFQSVSRARTEVGFIPASPLRCRRAPAARPGRS